MTSCPSKSHALSGSALSSSRSDRSYPSPPKSAWNRSWLAALLPDELSDPTSMMPPQHGAAGATAQLQVVLRRPARGWLRWTRGFFDI